MSRRFPVACLLLVMIVGCSEVPPGVSKGKRAPDIVGEDETGKTIKLSDYNNKVVLLDFWATWCGPCRQLIPNEQALMKTYGQRRFTILGVCRDEPASLQKMLQSTPLAWPNVVDSTGSICDTWGVKGFPTWVLLSDEGVILGRWVGGQDIAEVEQAVEKAVRTAETR